MLGKGRHGVLERCHEHGILVRHAPLAQFDTGKLGLAEPGLVVLERQLAADAAAQHHNAPRAAPAHQTQRGVHPFPPLTGGSPVVMPE